MAEALGMLEADCERRPAADLRPGGGEAAQSSDHHLSPDAQLTPAQQSIEISYWVTIKIKCL